MSRNQRHSLKRGLVIVYDLVATGFCWVLAFLLRYDFAIPDNTLTLLAWSTPVAVITYGLAYRWAQMYMGIWRYASIPDLVRIGKGVTAGMLLTLATLFLTVRGSDMPRSVLVIHPILLVFALGWPRLINRFRKMRWLGQLKNSKRPILLIGAGDAAELLVRESLRSDSTFQVVGLLDDDTRKHGMIMHDVRVLGPIDALVSTIAELETRGARPDEVVIAIPSASRDDIRRIIQHCESSGLPYRTAPSLDDIVTGRVSVGALREVTIEDLLGRASIRLDTTALRELITGKRVMVTGAGGSIGSELCRQIARFAPGELVLFEAGEYNLYAIDGELRRTYADVPTRAILGDVRNAARVRHILSAVRPDMVLHAAAYKHVPLVEGNPTEGLLNNILGTRTIAQACVEYEVPRFVLVSTDKAVNPVNVMGASKRLAEIYCQSLASAGTTAFITVRFGNVLGSMGSVVPLFREQIRRGGPVTVTHPDMQRYFMTIPEATQLILQAACIGNGGEIFVLDMGQPVKIVDLANDMIRLSGKEPGRDIEVQFSGLRPGEKLFEELLYDSEALLEAGHEKIFLSRQTPPKIQRLERRVEGLLEVCHQQDVAGAVAILRELVPEYVPADNGVSATAPENRAAV